VRLLLEPHCEILDEADVPPGCSVRRCLCFHCYYEMLDEADMPPGVTGADVEQAFQHMRLTETALRKFASRARRELKPVLDKFLPSRNPPQ
jgi:hypothetical protein